MCIRGRTFKNITWLDLNPFRKHLSQSLGGIIFCIKGALQPFYPALLHNVPFLLCLFRMMRMRDRAGGDMCVVHTSRVGLRPPFPACFDHCLRNSPSLGFSWGNYCDCLVFLWSPVAFLRHHHQADTSEPPRLSQHRFIHLLTYLGVPGVYGTHRFPEHRITQSITSLYELVGSQISLGCLLDRNVLLSRDILIAYCW